MSMPLLTEEQCAEAVRAMEKSGGVKTVAADSLGLDRNTFRHRLGVAYRRYGMQPLAPRIPVPHGQEIGKNTMAVNAKGEVTNQWARLHPTQEALNDWAEALERRVSGKCKKITPAKKTTGDLAEIIIGDPHAGMYAWAKETGSDYDLKHFAQLHTDGVRHLLQEIGPQNKIVLAYMGDLFHADNEKGMTERSRNVLDMDSRFSKVLDVVIETVTNNIELAANHCKYLDVVILRGNHDNRSAQWLQRVLAAYFYKSKHICIKENVKNRTYIRHNKVLLGYHHGDRLNANQMAMAMAQECGKDWGETEHRYWRCGHLHTSKRYRPMWDRDEAPGCQVEYFPVLAGLEAYGHEAGYNSRRAMVATCIDSHMGEYGRRIVTPEMLRKGKR